MMNKDNEYAFNLYNPATLNPEQLLAEFIDRKGLLEKILEIIRDNTSDRPQQHLVLIGPRGMGKTTLLCAIKHSVDREEALQSEWLPILFQEEQYSIGDLADFWLECLRHFPDGEAETQSLLKREPPNLTLLAQAAFFDRLAASGKRALLLVDNLNEIFDNIQNEQALHNLRALWMTDPRTMVIGASASYFDKITGMDEVFHDFFRVFQLDRLSQDELVDFLTRYAQMQGDEEVLAIINNAPERIAGLRILTGGNPRLVKLGYRVLRDGLNGDLRHDLERLLDDATPFFKHRIDDLSKDARRTFDAIARRWDPVTVEDIRLELRKPSNTISVQIRRLIDEGFVEEAFGHAKKKSYQISERFYNVYYLMRYSREGRQRLRWLVGFMQTFYSRKDYKHWANKLEQELATIKNTFQRSDTLAHLQALGMAADDDGRCHVFETLVRNAIKDDDRKILDEEIAQGDPIERFGWRYLLAEAVWLFSKAQRQSLGFRPNNPNWAREFHRQLSAVELMDTALQKLDGIRNNYKIGAPSYRAWGVLLEFFRKAREAEIAHRKALAINPDYINAWYSLGIVLADQKRYLEAESAYRKALVLDPDDVDAWHNLGVVLVDQNRYSEAKSAYRKALALDPCHFAVWNSLGNMLVDQKNYPEAESAYRKALALDPAFFYTWYNLGILLAEQNLQPEAESAYHKCLELEPGYVDAWNNLGNVFYDQKRYPDAESSYRKALELDPDHAYAWNGFGNVLADQKRYPEAESAYRNAIDLDANIGLIHCNLAGLYLMSLNQQGAGIAELLQGLGLDPTCDYGRWVLKQHWQIALPAATAQILANANGADNLLKAMTETLIVKAAGGNKKDVLLALQALDDRGLAIFEPLLLALQAQENREILYRIAKEKRELVMDVMAQLDP